MHNITLHNQWRNLPSPCSTANHGGS